MFIKEFQKIKVKALYLLRVNPDGVRVVRVLSVSGASAVLRRISLSPYSAAALWETRWSEKYEETSNPISIIMTVILETCKLMPHVSYTKMILSQSEVAF